MSKKYKRYTITAALPYTNGPIHIGHLSGVYLPSDIYARYLRLNKKDVLFLCGSDEHGVPIKISAKKEGVHPQKIVDKYHNLIDKIFKDFGISFDIYYRTSDKRHHRTASDFFLKLLNKKILYKKLFIIFNYLNQYMYSLEYSKFELHHLIILKYLLLCINILEFYFAKYKIYF